MLDTSRSVLRRCASSPGLIVGIAAAVAVTLPLLRRGYVLSYDMVFVPRQPITATTLGLDGSVPRPVPTDLVVALASRLIPADVVQKLLLVSVFLLAAGGVARLVPGRLPGAAAALAYSWNAFVAERLVIGHLSVLVGFGILPWATRSALGAPRSARALPVTCLWLLAAALCGATAGVTVAMVVLVVLLWQVGQRRLGWRAPLWVGLTALAVNAPWWVPALLRPGGIPADPRGVTAFAAHSDGPLGVMGSLFTLGGIWNAAVVPAERGETALVVSLLVGIVAALVVGAPLVARWWDGVGAGLLAAGVAAFVVSSAGHLPGTDWLLRVVVLHVPGGGLLRDGQKFLAPFVLCVALCVGATVERLLAARRAEATVLAVGLTVLPVVVLPGLAWGVAGRLSVARYPDDWSAVRRVVAASAERGDVAVLPWSSYRRFPWNGDRVVLDPAQRNFGRVVVTDDDLPLTSLTVRGEDRRAARISRGLATGEPLPPLLGELGVRFVLVERTVTGGSQVSLAGARMLFTGRDLDLYELDGVTPWHRGVSRVSGAGLVLCGLAGLWWAAVAVRRSTGRD